MALILGDNFSYQGSKPLDGRLTYNTVAAMKAVADATMYEGCLAFCIEADKTYQWKSRNTVDETTGKWREYSSGGGEGSGYGSIFAFKSALASENDTVTISDSLGNSVQGSFSNDGICILRGVTFVGILSFSVELSGTSTTFTKNIDYFSYYTIVINDDHSNFTYKQAYQDYADILVSNSKIKYEGTIFIDTKGSVQGKFASTSTNIYGMGANNMPQISGSTYSLFNNMITGAESENQSASNYIQTDITFNVPGLAIIGAKKDWYGGEKKFYELANQGNVFDLKWVEAGFSIHVPYKSTYDEQTWISFYSI